MGLLHTLALVLLATSLLVASASVLKVTPSESLPSEHLIQSDVVSDQTEVKGHPFQDLYNPLQASYQPETDLQTESQDLQTESQDLQTESQDLQTESQDLQTESQDLKTESQDLQNEEQTRPRKVFVIMHDKLNWFQARKGCEKLGKNLATIKSDEEQEALEQLMQNEGVMDEKLWVGGHDLFEAGKEGWAWRVGSNDEPFVYKHWDEREPNDVDGKQRCLQIHTKHNYLWDDSHCWIPLKYACENKVRENERILSKNKEGNSRQTLENSLPDDVIQAQTVGLIPLQTTALPDSASGIINIISVSNGAQNFQTESQGFKLEVKGLQLESQDFKLEVQGLKIESQGMKLEAKDLQPEEQNIQPEVQTRPHKVFAIMQKKLNWFRAREACEKSGKNLATIRSDEEQKALEQLIQDKGMINENFWLGVHDLFEAGKEGWSWRVGSNDEPFSYTHWGEGEPNNWNGIPQQCLQMRGSHNYFWDDFQCSELLKFVCENRDKEV